MSGWTAELARAALVGAGFLGVFAAAEGWRRWRDPGVECTRKFVHFACGLLVAVLPWLFASPWTVLGLGSLFILLMAVTRTLGWLPSIHGVERPSGGTLYYPIAVCTLYLLARDQPVLYLISILTLVVSDALAAVLGSAYGRWIYAVETDRRSVEGSAVFFLATFVVVHLPLLLMTEIDRAACVLTAVQVALLVTAFEAISLRGSDNLIVPLSAYYLLLKLTPRPAEWIGMLLLAQLAILLVVALLGWRTRLLNSSGVVAAHLFLYGALSLGGPRWFLAAAMAFGGVVSLEALSRRLWGGSRGGYQVLSVFYVSLVALVLLLASNTAITFMPSPRLLARGNPFYAPFVGALAAQVALLAFRTLQARPARLSSAGAQALLAGTMAFALVAPASLWFGTGGLGTRELAVAAVITFGALPPYILARGWAHWSKTDVRTLQLQATSVALTTAVAVPLYLRWLGVG